MRIEGRERSGVTHVETSTVDKKKKKNVEFKFGSSRTKYLNIVSMNCWKGIRITRPEIWEK